MVKKEAWHAFSGEEVQRADRKCERAAAYLSTALTRFMATARRAASNAARKEAFSLFFFFFSSCAMCARHVHGWSARAANILELCLRISDPEFNIRLFPRRSILPASAID